MNQGRNLTPWVLGIAMACFVACGPLRAGDPPAESLLTVGRLFGVKEFDTEPLPAHRWSKQSPTYYTLEKGTGRAGRDLIRNDLATGKKEVVLPASVFLPKAAKEPLEVEAFEFSADETRLLIYTNSQRVWRRNTRGDYWVLDVKGQSLRKLGGDGPRSSMMFATLSPDGRRVAFVRENNLFVQSLDDLKITPLTADGSKTLINGTSDWVNEEELGLRNCFRWSPDGGRILFWQFDTTGVSEFHLVDNVVSTSPRVTSFAYPKAGGKNSATRLGVIPAAGGKVQWLDLPSDPREHYLPHAEWTPDGSQILVQRFNRLQTELRVWRVDPATGKATAVLTETDSAWLENENPFRWLNGGKSFLWLSERSGWRHAYRAHVDGSPLEPITKGDFDVIGVEAVDEPGGWLYYAASPNNATQRYLFRVKLDGSTTESLTPSTQTGWNEYDFSPDAKWAVHIWSNFTTPPAVKLVRPADHTIVRTFTENAKLRAKLAALKRPAIEFMRVPIGNGITLDGWSMKPANVKSTAKLPLLMYVYGEPHGQTVRDAWPGLRGLWHWMLAQQGFVVASVDNRGTNVPRGRKWRKSVHRKIGILAPTEQAAAARTLLKQWPFVDPGRVGSWGWSGGGSMSLNALFRHPDLYRTAIAVAPVADQRLYDTIYQERYMGLPAENEAGYRDGSPITHAGNLRGNLLLVHGTGDDNCHYQGTERLMEELIAKGKRFSVLPYPNRTHAIKEGRNTNQHLMEMMTRFLHDNLLSAHAPAPEPVYEVRKLRGWSVHINRVLLAADVRQTTKALELLDKQLKEITEVVPKAAVVKLQKVPLYFNPEYPGKRPIAEYHPGAGWLRDNGRDPAMAKAVEFTNVRIFEAEVNRMPNFALHELAHAYHDRELPKGFRNSQIAAAFARAKDSGKYDKVERHFGNGKPNTREKAYALTNPMEYFAETTEAYFSRNDFFPFTREELKKHDPEMDELLGKLWEEPADRIPRERPGPNIVFIFVDNFGNGDLGCFGSKLHRTPNVDRLAAEGTKFTSFYVSSGVCTPSRASLMTGCYPRRVNMHVSGTGGAVLQPISVKGLHPNEVTIAEVLKSVGYATACIGKWHLGDQPDFFPMRQGFDEFFGIPYSDDMTKDKKPDTWPDLPLMRGSKVIEAPANRDTLVKRCTEEAIKFIEQNSTQPFFLYVPHTMPGSTAHPFASKAFQGRSKNGKYGDAVEELDWSTGEIMAALRRLDLEKNTLVIWTSDNGAVNRRPRQGNNAPYRGWGYDTSEGAMRMPCVMRWPGKIPASAVNDALCSTMDMLPTFAALVHAQLPKAKIDGHDIRSILFHADSTGSPWDEKGFFFYRMEQLQAVRAGDWKLHLPLEEKFVSLSRQTERAKLELYDVRHDVGEEREVSAKHPEVVKRLTRLAEQARLELGDGKQPGKGQREAGFVKRAVPLVP